MQGIYEALQAVKKNINMNSKDFIQEGFLDSFDLVNLISELEERYDILIDGEDIIPMNFKNTEAIKSLIEKSGGILE